MKLFRNLLKGLSLTSALFVVQACYGTPQPSMFGEGGEAPMSFSLVAEDTGEPLEGIVISANRVEGQNKYELGITDADGKCRTTIPYMRNLEGPFLKFEDPEGKYSAKDTVIADLRDREILIRLEQKR
ncbi:MAG: hypothetical protein IKH93_07640 [Bacteroidales bacterium]|nr:hypothetical protein [Bacteroidales bacterium]